MNARVARACHRAVSTGLAKLTVFERARLPHYRTLVRQLKRSYQRMTPHWRTVGGFRRGGRIGGRIGLAFRKAVGRPT